MQRSTAALASLLILAIGVQWWSIEHAVTPALDAVRYVNIAQRYERDGLLTTLRNEPEHPLFPALVWMAHRAVGSMTSNAPPWVDVAQWTAAGMLILSVVPVWFLLRHLVDLSEAVAGTLFFCILPEVACLGADALSDSTQILLLATALWALARYWGQESGAVRASRRKPDVSAAGQEPGIRGQESGVRSQGAVWLLVAGMAMAMALLARPETLVLGPTILFVLFWLQGNRELRQPWARLLGGIACFTVGMAMVISPYLWASDALTPRTAWGRLLGRDLVESQPGAHSSTLRVELPGLESQATIDQCSPHAPREDSLPHAEREGYAAVGRAGANNGRGFMATLADGEPMSFAIKDSSTTSRFQGYRAATLEFLKELPELFHYWIGGLALLGLWQLRPALGWSFSRDPQGSAPRRVQPQNALPCGSRLNVSRQTGGLPHGRAFSSFAVAYFAIHSLAVVQHAAGGGYLSPRHLIPLLLLGLAPAGGGACALGKWLADRFTSFGKSSLPLAQPQLAHMLAFATVAIAAAACLPRTLAPLHASRQGHRLAGEWLANHATDRAVVLDTRGISGLYSGRSTVRYDVAQSAFEHPELEYIVLEQRELEFDSPRSRTLQHLLHSAAQRVAVFESPKGRPPDAVVIYQWHSDRFAQLERPSSLTN